MQQSTHLQHSPTSHPQLSHLEDKNQNIPTQSVDSPPKDNSQSIQIPSHINQLDIQSSLQYTNNHHSSLFPHQTNQTQYHQSIHPHQIDPKLTQLKYIQQKLVEQKLVEQKLAQQKLVEQKLVEQKLIEQSIQQKQVEQKSDSVIGQKSSDDENYKPETLSHYVSIEWDNIQINKSSLSNSFVDPLNISENIDTIQSNPNNNKQVQSGQIKFYSEQAIALQNQLHSQQVIKNAYMERLHNQHQLIKNHIYQIQNTIAGNQKIINNVGQSLNKRIKYKIVPSFTLQQYFKQYGYLCKQFHQKSYYINHQTFKKQKEILDIGYQLSEGVDQLINLQKSTGYFVSKLKERCEFKCVQSIKELFSQNLFHYQENYKKYIFAKNSYESMLKKYTKVVNKIKFYIDSNQTSKLNTSDDIFVLMVNYINHDYELLQSLELFGKQFVQLKRNYVKSQINLYLRVYQILEEFKKSQNVQINQQQQAKNSQKIQQEIKIQLSYYKLCQQSDIEYLKSFIKKDITNQNEQLLTNKKQFNDQQIQSILQLNHSFISYSKAKSLQLLKNIISKRFQLQNPRQELIISVSNHLIYFDCQQLICGPIFNLENIQVEVRGSRIIEIKQKVKNFLFQNKKSIIVVLKDQDRAQQLLFHLTNQCL